MALGLFCAIVSQGASVSRLGLDVYRAPKEDAQQAFSSHLTIVPSDASFFCDFLPCPDSVKYDLKKVLMAGLE